MYKKVVFGFLMLLFFNGFSQSVEEVNIMMDSARSLKFVNPQNSIAYFEKIRMVTQEKEYTLTEIYVLTNLSHLYFTSFKFELSMKYILEAKGLVDGELREMHDSTRYYNPLGIIYNRIGLLLLEKKSYQSAISHFKIAQHAFEKADDKERQSSVLTNIGLCEARQYQYSKAIEYYNRAYELAEITNRENALARLDLNFAVILASSDANSEALLRINQAFKRIEDDDDMWLKGALYNLKGWVLIKTGDFKEANNCLNIAYSFAIQVKAYNLLSENSYSMSQLYEKMGDYAMALKMIRTMIEYDDTLVSIKRLQQMSDYFELTRITESEKEVILVRKEKELMTLRMSMMAGLAVFLLLMLVLSISYFKLKSRQRQLLLKQSNQMMSSNKREYDLKQQFFNEEMKYRKSELTTIAMHLANRTDFIETVKSKIKSLRKKSSEENRDAIANILVEINSLTQNNKELAALNESVEKLSVDFSRTLKERFSQLSDKDTRMCALLRMGVSSKEIALFFAIETRSVIQARYRLRKKFGLQNEDSIVDFLKNI